jgi:hypothetical protein
MAAAAEGRGDFAGLASLCDSKDVFRTGSNLTEVGRLSEVMHPLRPNEGKSRE